MSKKSSKPAKPKSPVPRTKDAIELDYGRLVAQSGQAQYQAYIYQEEVKRLNEQLRNLNFEANARQQLDREEAEAKAPQPTAAPTTEAPAVQS